MIEDNPTRTKTIQNNWYREINKRWSQFRKVTIDELKKYNTINNAVGYTFEMSASQQRIYMEFLQLQIDELLMGGVDSPPNWQEYYQVQAYQRGIEKTRSTLRSAGANLQSTAEEIAKASTLTTFTAVSTLGSASSIPIHSEALSFLYTRSFEKLKGWTDAIASETRQILHDGVSQGQGVEEIARNMVARQDVSRTRARVIARTETIQAYQVSSANEAERSSEELGEEVMIRWISGLGPNVRHLHASWHGTVTSVQEYRRRIQVSPWNCVCAGIPVLAEFNTEAKNEKFARERKVMLDREKRKSR